MKQHDVTQIRSVDHRESNSSPGVTRGAPLAVGSRIGNFQVDLAANVSPTAQQLLEATHHQGKNVGKDGAIEAAGMSGHTDDELVMLEALVGRKPPFAV